jgi:hypothetical protein
LPHNSHFAIVIPYFALNWREIAGKPNIQVYQTRIASQSIRSKDSNPWLHLSEAICDQFRA